MFSPEDILIKTISLLYWESQLRDSKGENDSRDIIVNVLSELFIENDYGDIYNSHNALNNVKEYVLEMCKDPPETMYDKDELLQTLQSLLGTEEHIIYQNVKQAIDTEKSLPAIRGFVISARRTLSNYFRKTEIEKVLKRTLYEYKKAKTLKELKEVLDNHISQLESLKLNSGNKDPAVKFMVDLGDDKSLTELFDNIKTHIGGNGILKTGWKDLNKMTQGGIRRGQTTIVYAMPHNYKTGFTLSVFEQIALFNRPNPNSNKKPLLLRISLEDEIHNNIAFMYMGLKYMETGEEVDIDNIPLKEMSSYVKERLSVNGFHIHLARVDPSEWSYRHLFNMIVDLEAQGYEIYLCMVDYLSLVPTIGCNRKGATGTDVRDLFRRVRNFMAIKDIAFVTPHQLSTEAKALLRSGINPFDFVKEVHNKGYIEGTKQIEQEADLEIYIHIAIKNKKSYLTVQRNKHRLPTVISPKYRYFILPFPDNGMPIPPDEDIIDVEGNVIKEVPKISFREPPSNTDTTSNEDTVKDIFS